MKALEFLKQERAHHLAVHNDKSIIEQYDEAIKELEAHSIVYQTIRNRLDNTVITLAVLQNGNKALVKTLEKMNEEMIDLRKENQDLKNSNNELLKGLKSTQKRLEEWLEKCK